MVSTFWSRTTCSPSTKTWAHRPVGRRIDERSKRIVTGSHRGMGAVRDDDVRLAADCEPPDVVAPERPRAANGRRVEYLGHADAARTLRNDAPDVGSKPHFIEHVVRVDVRADSHVDAAPHVAAEVAQRDAAAREYGWAMRDRRAASRQGSKIIGLRPVRPGVMIEEDAVTDDRARREHAKRVQPFDRRLAVPADDFVKLRQRLRCMGLIGQAAPGPLR